MKIWPRNNEQKEWIELTCNYDALNVVIVEACDASTSAEYVVGLATRGFYNGHRYLAGEGTGYKPSQIWDVFHLEKTRTR